MTELTRTASEMFVNTARFLDAYHAVMQPLCTEAKLPPVALDIINAYFSSASTTETIEGENTMLP